jgi:hypothetical protein
MGYLWEYPKIQCPDDCKYRNKLAPFCGYCLPDVMRKLGMRKEKEDKDGNRQEEGGSSGQNQ